MAKRKQRGGIYTKTRCGKLERIRVECQLAPGDAFNIRPAWLPDGSLLLQTDNIEPGVIIPRNRALRLARLIRTMALQLPKEGK